MTITNDESALAVLDRALEFIDEGWQVYDDLRQARDYLQRRLGDGGWQPIATAPTYEAHIRGLWVTTKRPGQPEQRDWRAYFGYVNDRGKFVDTDYDEDFGWEADDYEAWCPTPPAPDAEDR